MTQQEQLVMLKNQLANLETNSITSALFILVDHMIEAGDGNISFSDKDTGINITENGIDIVDLNFEVTVASLKMNF
jgi:hypothetical protein